MADDVMTDANAPAAAGAGAKGPSKTVGLIAALVFLLAVVLVECLVAFFVFPSKDDIAAAVVEPSQGKDGDDASSGSGLPLEDEAAEDLVEVSLGEFGVSSYQPLTNTTLRIDFELYGIVLQEDASTVEQLLEENRHRYREGVIVIMRSAEMTDFTDAGLGLIKRKILEKTNRTLGRALLRDVVFSEFSFIEQ